ncbi:hypothetical protein ACP70R_000013 [Stipagrostis hirtigluma subsp. patula]
MEQRLKIFACAIPLLLLLVATGVAVAEPTVAEAEPVVDTTFSLLSDPVGYPLCSTGGNESCKKACKAIRRACNGFCTSGNSCMCWAPGRC